MHQLRAIQKALGLIEQQLNEPLRLEALARAVGMSLWHFQRTFSAMVGEPVGSYIRRRRLTEAARRLRESDGTILDIALDYQFESHEAFTRAFKAEMQVTPSVWRAHGAPAALGRDRVQLTAETLNRYYRHMNLKPEIITLPARTFTGLQARFIPAVSPDTNNLQVIPQLWAEFTPRIAEASPIESDVAYGLSDCAERAGEKATRPDEAVYLAAVQVAKTAKPPRGMVTWTSPAGSFAKFTHRGPITKIAQTIGYIYGKWLPGSGHDRGAGPDIERYDARFSAESEQSELEIFVPLARERR